MAFTGDGYADFFTTAMDHPLGTKLVDEHVAVYNAAVGLANACIAVAVGVAREAHGERDKERDGASGGAVTAPAGSAAHDVACPPHAAIETYCAAVRAAPSLVWEGEDLQEQGLVPIHVATTEGAAAGAEGGAGLSGGAAASSSSSSSLAVPLSAARMASGSTADALPPLHPLESLPPFPRFVISHASASAGSLSAGDASTAAPASAPLASELLPWWRVHAVMGEWLERVRRDLHLTH